MLPTSYRIAFSALEAIWDEKPSDALGILSGGMRPMDSADDSMDSGALYDWNKLAAQTLGASELDLILAYLELDASRYRSVPQDLSLLIVALRTEGSREREIVRSVIRDRNGAWP
jgi:hypothetical protein